MSQFIRLEYRVVIGLLGLLGSHQQVRVNKPYQWFCQGQSLKTSLKDITIHIDDTLTLHTIPYITI